MLLKLLVFVAAVTFVAAGLGPKKKFFNPEVFIGDEEVIDDVAIAPFADPIDGIDYRLPNDTIPLRYDIWLSTDIHRGDFAFNGRVTIQIQAVTNTPQITLHIRQLTIVKVDLLSATGLNIQSDVPTTLRNDVEFLIIRPTAALVQGTIYNVVITYTGTLRNDDAGFYRSSYVNSFGRTVWLATTQFESTDARHAFPW
jgi:aminopeptidase N